ncbi:MAG: four helix bundle protein [Candidatus Omnitrophica bacterium]|nr:four helix bundle protein [Candidatus Omnitrophota bacterium]
MQIKSFKDYKVWQKAHSFVLELYKITKEYPSDERFGLISQVRRSAVSVCANIAEGYKKSTKDFMRFIDIAQGSLEETKYYLILSNDLGYLNKNQFNDLYEKTEEVGRMLGGLKGKLRSSLTP